MNVYSNYQSVLQINSVVSRFTKHRADQRSMYGVNKLQNILKNRKHHDLALTILLTFPLTDRRELQNKRKFTQTLIYASKP